MAQVLVETSLGLKVLFVVTYLIFCYLSGLFFFSSESEEWLGGGPAYGFDLI